MAAELEKLFAAIIAQAASHAAAAPDLAGLIKVGEDVKALVATLREIPGELSAFYDDVHAVLSKIKAA